MSEMFFLSSRNELLSLTTHNANDLIHVVLNASWVVCIPPTWKELNCITRRQRPARDHATNNQAATPGRVRYPAFLAVGLMVFWRDYWSD